MKICGLRYALQLIIPTVKLIYLSIEKKIIKKKLSQKKRTFIPLPFREGVGDNRVFINIG